MYGPMYVGADMTGMIGPGRDGMLGLPPTPAVDDRPTPRANLNTDRNIDTNHPPKFSEIRIFPDRLGKPPGVEQCEICNPHGWRTLTLGNP